MLFHKNVSITKQSNPSENIEVLRRGKSSRFTFRSIILRVHQVRNRVTFYYPQPNVEIQGNIVSHILSDGTNQWPGTKVRVTLVSLIED